MTILKPLLIAAALSTALVSVNAWAMQPVSRAYTIAPTSALPDASSPPIVRQNVYTFEQMDNNHDGLLRRAELPLDARAMRVNFNRIDFDGNGGLSRAEIAQYIRGSAPQYVGVYHAVTFVISAQPAPLRMADMQ